MVGAPPPRSFITTSCSGVSEKNWPPADTSCAAVAVTEEATEDVIVFSPFVLSLCLFL